MGRRRKKFRKPESSFKIDSNQFMVPAAESGTAEKRPVGRAHRKYPQGLKLEDWRPESLQAFQDCLKNEDFSHTGLTDIIDRYISMVRSLIDSHVFAATNYHKLEPFEQKERPSFTDKNESKAERDHKKEIAACMNDLGFMITAGYYALYLLYEDLLSKTGTTHAMLSTKPQGMRIKRSFECIFSDNVETTRTIKTSPRNLKNIDWPSYCPGPIKEVFALRLECEKKHNGKPPSLIEYVQSQRQKFRQLSRKQRRAWGTSKLTPHSTALLEWTLANKRKIPEK